MKVSVDGVDILELTDVQKQVIMNDIPESKFDEDMKGRLQYILTHKYEQCYKRLKEEWEPKLAATMDSLPTNAEAFAKLVFAQPDYKSREVRMKEELSQG
jgi:hypothetical protein